MLFGRDAERSLIAGLLDGARASRGGALVVLGEAGVGKSALLEDARAGAAGMRVLGARGVESEARLPFAGLHQLVRPLLEGLDRLPAPQAAALRGALGIEAGGGGGDPFLVSLAVLSLLADAAERRPVLCVVDDAHWLDEPSADALVFVARRLEAEAVALVFAARAGEARRFDAPGLPELRLGGLDADAAGALLDREAGGALSPEVRTRLIEEAGGNPLALLELPRALSAAQRSGDEPLDGPLPVGVRVEDGFLRRVRRLPEATQTLLLVAAADDSGRLATVLRAGRRLGAGPDALDPAERAGLVGVRGGRLELRHPLVRSAVYHGAPLSRRRAAHLALADALADERDADRRAWHRAAASVEPDPSVVAELERAALRARARSAYAASSQAFERAAALADGEEQRARHLTAAAEDAWWTGRIERSQALVARARTLAADPVLLADIDRWRGLIELTRGAPADAHEILAGAARAVAPRDGERALYLLALGSVAAQYAGDPGASVAIAATAGAAEPVDTALGRFLRPLLAGFGAHSARDFATSSRCLRAALAEAEALDDATLAAWPGLLPFAGAAAVYLGDDLAAHGFHHRAEAGARARGALGLLTQILPRLANTQIALGRWRAAEAGAREGLRLAQEVGQHDVAAHLTVVLANIAALRGDEDDCRALAADSAEMAAARGLAHVADFSRGALAGLELALGRPEDAARCGAGIATMPAVAWTALDGIEAAARAGDRQAARARLAAFEPWAACTGSPWALAVAAHGHAVLSDDPEEAEGRFAAALAAHAGASRPFELARTRLALGELLRRVRRRVNAREHLRAALDAFGSLGAEAWAERARVELRASGQTARRRDPSAAGALTPQELQVARFVAQGMPNREVAAQLFLSPRTVNFHLRNVFRKLGITTRTALARVELDGADRPGRRRDDPAVPPARGASAPS